MSNVYNFVSTKKACPRDCRQFKRHMSFKSSCLGLLTFNIFVGERPCDHVGHDLPQSCAGENTLHRPIAILLCTSAELPNMFYCSFITASTLLQGITPSYSLLGSKGEEMTSAWEARNELSMCSVGARLDVMLTISIVAIVV